MGAIHCCCNITGLERHVCFHSFGTISGTSTTTVAPRSRQYIKCGVIIVSTVIVGTEEVGVEVAEKMESSEACDDDVWRMYSNVIRYVMRYQRIHTIIHLLISCVGRRKGRKKLAFLICLWVLSNRKVY